MQTPTQTDRAVDFAYTDYPYEDNALYYAQARYYKPEVGRVISEDIRMRRTILWALLTHQVIILYYSVLFQ
ncbi:hypothetical protein GCM10008933_16280 [Paenibacillus motobuensis]|uniref:Uncharacterized protein n=1 Tax=Paenibacillus motobuensis TaxID=295324 RepID=A0ABP3I0J4_9BACL